MRVLSRSQENDNYMIAAGPHRCIVRRLKLETSTCIGRAVMRATARAPATARNPISPTASRLSTAAARATFRDQGSVSTKHVGWISSHGDRHRFRPIREGSYPTLRPSLFTPTAWCQQKCGVPTVYLLWTHRSHLCMFGNTTPSGIPIFMPTPRPHRRPSTCPPPCYPPPPRYPPPTTSVYCTSIWTSPSSPLVL